LSYIREAAAERGIDGKIRFGQQVKRAAWSSADEQWTLDVECRDRDETLRYHCKFLLTCAGYYNDAAGYSPPFPGAESFRGRIVHPQEWPRELDYSGQRVVVIGSGATAVTLVPELAKQAAHVTMLQRSPTYVLSRTIRSATPTPHRVASVR
jgi:monooxygenase